MLLLGYALSYPNQKSMNLNSPLIMGCTALEQVCNLVAYSFLMVL